MSFDAWVVGFGLSRVLIELNFMKSPWAYSVMAATILIDVYLLYIFFTVHKAASIGSQAVRAPLISGGGSGLRDRVRSLMNFPATRSFPFSTCSVTSLRPSLLRCWHILFPRQSACRHSVKKQIGHDPALAAVLLEMMASGKVAN